MKYQKSPTHVEDLITILKSRKLAIPDLTLAEKYLKTIGYYRLTGYMYHLQESDGSHNFKENISFDNILYKHLRKDQ